MNNFQRIWRAFWGALRHSLRGGQSVQPPAPRYPALASWMARISPLLDAVYAAADSAGLDSAARAALKLTVDRREISIETILAALRHNLAEEYPLLIETYFEHNLTTLYAINLNDARRVAHLAQWEALQDYLALTAALVALAAHLQAIPDSTTLEEIPRAQRFGA